MESKIRHKRTYLRNGNRITALEDRLVVAKGEGVGGGDGVRGWGQQMEALYIGWIHSKVLL